jgi:hypothetical protein
MYDAMRNARKFLRLDPDGTYALYETVVRDGLERTEEETRTLEVGQWRLRPGEGGFFLCFQASRTQSIARFGDGCGLVKAANAVELHWQWRIAPFGNERMIRSQ